MTSGRTPIVGYSIDSNMKATLAVRALHSAIGARPHQGCVLHSDRGSQFRTKKYVRTLTNNGLLGSMGRVGACADNAAMESFFALLQLYASGPMSNKIEQTHDSFFDAFTAYEQMGKNLGVPLVRDDRSGIMPDWPKADRAFRVRGDEIVNMVRAELKVVRRRGKDQISNEFQILPRGSEKT